MAPPPLLPRGVASFTPLLQYSLNGFAVVDGDGRYRWVSDSLCLLLALDKQALLGCVAAAAARAHARYASNEGVMRLRRRALLRSLCNCSAPALTAARNRRRCSLLVFSDEDPNPGKSVDRALRILTPKSRINTLGR